MSSRKLKKNKKYREKENGWYKIVYYNDVDLYNKREQKEKAIKRKRKRAKRRARIRARRRKRLIKLDWSYSYDGYKRIFEKVKSGLDYDMCEAVIILNARSFERRLEIMRKMNFIQNTLEKCRSQNSQVYRVLMEKTIRMFKIQRFKLEKFNEFYKNKKILSNERYGKNFKLCDTNNELKERQMVLSAKFKNLVKKMCSWMYDPLVIYNKEGGKCPYINSYYQMKEETYMKVNVNKGSGKCPCAERAERYYNDRIVRKIYIEVYFKFNELLNDIRVGGLVEEWFILQDKHKEVMKFPIPKFDCVNYMNIIICVK